MDKIRIGQVVLIGENNFEEHTILSISEDPAKNLLFCSDKKSDIRENDIFCIVGGPVQPETEDVTENITVPVPLNAPLSFDKLTRGCEVVYTCTYQDAELEIEGYVFVPGHSFSILTEKGVSAPNRFWRVHNSLIKRKYPSV